MMDTGTEMLGMNVDQALRRKRNTTSTTSTMETIMLRCASRSESRVVMVRSLAILKRTVGRKLRLKLRHQCLDARTVSTMLAPGCRLTWIWTIGLPLTTPKLRTSSFASITRPRSERRTGAPLR